ncbi:unnamed protein product [Linum trigynum]|uniref:Uncharacterized protein n=1 Tax=Linum trigynum TaxID=586398 RepID=A0AAV2E3U4_9ROSI
MQEYDQRYSSPPMSVQRAAFCLRVHASLLSSGTTPSSKYLFIGALQSSFYAICVVLTMMSWWLFSSSFWTETRRVNSKSLAVASLDSASACMFSSLGICTYVTASKVPALRLTRCMYCASVSSFASKVPFSWLTASKKSNSTLIVLAPSSLAAVIPAKMASYLAALFVFNTLNQIAISWTTPVGVRTTTPAPAPCLLAAPSTYTSHTPSGVVSRVTPSAMKSASISAFIAGLGAYWMSYSGNSTAHLTIRPNTSIDVSIFFSGRLVRTVIECA